MQKIFIVNILFLIFNMNLQAEEKCDMRAVDNGNQYAMNICASIDYIKADKILNTTYTQLLKMHKNNKSFTDNLKTAQRAWMKFRDSEIKMKLTYVNMPDNYGTMNAMLLSIEMQILTEERTKTLRKYIKDGILDQP